MTRRLLLDTNALIALSDPTHPLFQLVEAALRAGATASTCVVAWHEYVRGPLLKLDRDRALRIIESRILALERGDAERASEFYNVTGRRRGSTADCLIASVAVGCKAEIVTWNRSDFEVFVPLGLRMAEVP